MHFIKKIQSYSMFIRPFAFIGTAIIFVCSSLIAINTPPYVQYSWLHILLGALSCGLLASASHALNNIFDLEIDKINKPFRALPSKKISLREAWIFTILLYALSFLLSLYVKTELFFITLIIAGFSFIYSSPPFRTKRLGILENITIAIPRGLLIILAGWSVIKSVFEVTPWYIGSISMLFLIGAISTKDFKDLKGDKLHNCYTLPVKYGIKKTIKLISPFFIFPFLLIPLGVYLNILKNTTLPLTLLLFYGIFIIWLMKNKQDKLTKIEKNHISWKHTYILYMLLQAGLALAYVI